MVLKPQAELGRVVPTPSLYRCGGGRLRDGQMGPGGHQPSEYLLVKGSTPFPQARQTQWRLYKSPSCPTQVPSPAAP